MKHACEHCGQKYAIPDARVAGKHLKVRCQKCSGVMRVDGTAVSADGSKAETIKPRPSMLGLREWHVGLAGRPCGPYTKDELLSLVDGGEVRERTLLWRTGMKTWQRVSDAGELTFVLDAVREREANAGKDAFRTPTGVFEAVPPALVSDGRSYFPDPTLHSGWSVLSEDAKAYLEAVARRDAEYRRGPFEAYMLPMAVFTALSILGAAGAWAATLM